MSDKNLRRLQDLAWAASRKGRTKLKVNKFDMAEYFANKSNALITKWEQEQIKKFM